MEEILTIPQRRKRVALSQSQAAKVAHMPPWAVRIIENPAKMDEYRARLEESLKRYERERAAELLAA